MPNIQFSNFTCHYQFDNFGHEKTLVLSNSLGTNLHMWEDNIDVLSHHFNILRYDKRGHGASSIHQNKVSIADLGNDVIELLDYLKLDHVYFCGLSIGGLTGQWLGIHHPARFNKIIISNTAAKIGNEEGWNTRVKQVTEHGLQSILTGTAERWFTATYRAKEPQKVHEILQNFESNTLQGYTACCYAVAQADFREQLHLLEVPTLIIAGTADEVTTLTDGKFMQKRIPNASLVTLDAAHLSNMEHPEEFAKHIIHFTQH
ncbi:3-oxoadipate enol-lactonase [Sphingobacterium sp. ML3W]|uniref:3-oxoadipate enol-lactonase n=1 Tax=Sphingobacterium TaxID=28453 RepID=UPI0004F760BD|nr:MULTISPECIES: 3-oxoadipate enol-lactonase [Sphingobacterium]AIM38020.1 3-oxoadipate enol-lactonase [Sphingobacterium sp. ML3W]MDH5825920.1 3-oxoadipate enol-lactonase [Sphingobacterium faecium]